MRSLTSVELASAYLAKRGLRGFCYSGGLVFANTRDEAVVERLKSLGATARSYPPEQASDPQAVAWELNLGKLPGARSLYAAVRERAR